MGSYCDLKFDGLSVWPEKSFVPDRYCALFQETDRREGEPLDGESADGAENNVFYRAPRQVVLDRLSLMGYSKEVAETAFNTWLSDERKLWSERAEDSDGEWAREARDAIHQLTYEDWQCRVKDILRTRYAYLDDPNAEEPKPKDETDNQMRNNEAEWLWFGGHGNLVCVRAMLDACDFVQRVFLDITDLVGGGYIAAKERICDEARSFQKFEPRPLAPIVVLAEGASDIRVLRASLAKLFPERRDYFTFFDHAELKVDGGASYLIKFLKAFAAAGSPFRLVAVFDNDTIGVQSLRQAEKLGLPTNMALLRMPDIAIARNYPTVGPQGKHSMDVNGLAAGIELYLGHTALEKNGELRPVHWAGYVQGANAYQGEVEAKGEVESSFLEHVRSIAEGETARIAFPDLCTLWESIFSAVERASSQQSTYVLSRHPEF
jgi:hypothetical protein